MSQHANAGVISMVSTLQKQGQDENGIEGVIQAGSYNPADGSVQVVMAHTVAAAAFTDAGGNQIYPTIVGARLETHGYGDQYGPVGGERCVLRKAGTHYTAILEHNEDDSPGAPSGERWAVHRGTPNGDAPGEVNAWWKLTNDGAPGDGLGGFKVMAGTRAMLETAGGIVLQLDDATHTATLEGAATVLIESTTGQSIGVSAAGVTFNGASTTAANGLVTRAFLVAFMAQLQTALATWASTSLQGGSGASGPTLSFVPLASTEAFAI